jgi:hypothetical protein
VLSAAKSKANQEGAANNRDEDQSHDQIWRHGGLIPRTGRRPYQPAFMLSAAALQDPSSACHGRAFWGERNRRERKLQGKLPVT